MACALAQTVVDPLMCGIAGFGTAAVYVPGTNVHEYFDFHATAPGGARPDMWADLLEGEARDGFGFFIKDRLNDIGYQSMPRRARCADSRRCTPRTAACPGPKWSPRPWTGRGTATSFAPACTPSGTTKLRWAAPATGSGWLSARRAARLLQGRRQPQVHRHAHRQSRHGQRAGADRARRCRRFLSPGRLPPPSSKTCSAMAD